MNLKFPDLSSNTIVNGSLLGSVAINTIIQQLLQNDKQLVNPGGFAPKIWECKWYNNDEISGYPAGYAVWYNTESPELFIDFYSELIYNYAKDNVYLKSIVKPYTQSQYDLYYSILTGYQPTNARNALQPLFDIGNITDKAQIKISLKDNNKQCPNDPTAWKDFIIQDNYSSISSIISSMMSTLLAEHMLQFHFGNNNFDRLDDYLLTDMSNMKNIQHYDFHSSSKDMLGFEYVKKFVKVPIEESYQYSVISSNVNSTHLYINDYETLTKNGKITDDTKNKYKMLLNGCANYVSSDVEQIINSLETDAIVGITYSGINQNIIPTSTEDYSLISSRLDKYNCSFNVVPLTAYDKTTAGSNARYYTAISSNDITYYPNVKYKHNKWFRYWSSGKLEYGGIVKVDDLNKVNVDFGWKYVEDGTTLSAPIYDYPTTAKSFYGPYTRFSTALDSEYDATNNLEDGCRYVVQLTPVYATLSAHLSGDATGYMYDKQFFDYAVNEANTFKNTGFSIYIDNPLSVQYYLYYVTGFKANG